MKLNLTAIEILEKEFKSNKSRGYDTEEIDTFLDLIIQDYIKFEKMAIKLKELEIENQSLKITINGMKNVKKDVESSPSNVNLDILKRISRLEQAVFGINND